MDALTLSQSKLPKYLALTEFLRGELERKSYAVGEKLPTVADIKKQFGVSNSTIEKVFSLLEQDGLIVRTQGSGVFVAPPKTRALTGVIGFLTGCGADDLRPPYWTHLQTGIQRAAAKTGYEVLLVSSDRENWENLDGVIAADLRPLENVPSWVPRVVLILETQRGDNILVDDFGGGLAATQHLLELGHRKIGCLTVEHPNAFRRLAGYREALQGAGIRPQPTWVHLFESSEMTGPVSLLGWGQNSMAHWLETGWKETGCTALVAHNDEIAIGAMKAFSSAGVKVGRDVSVIGFDGTEIGEYCHPRLSSIQVPLEEMGERGFETLLRRLHSPGKEDERVVLPVGVQSRESSAPPRK